MLDLATFARPVVERLPLDDEDDMTLSAETLPCPPAELEAAGLNIHARHLGRVFENTYWDVIALIAEGAVFRDLGVLVFAALMHDCDVTVHLTAPPREDPGGLELRRLRVHGKFDTGEPYPCQLTSRPVAYSYWPEADRPRHPFRDEAQRDEWRLPYVRWEVEDLGNGLVTSEEVNGFGTAEGGTLLASLLLDIGNPANERREYVLEGPGGIQGVAPLSAELRLLVSNEPWDWTTG